MRFPGWLPKALVALPLVAMACPRAQAAEYGFSTYALGGNAFGAGQTPPPGTYVTTVTGYYSGDIGATVNFDRVTLNAGAKVQGFTSAANLLYVSPRKLFEGNLGFSITVPFGRVGVDATIAAGPIAGAAEVDGWGLGDIIPKVQLGWQHGEFAHTVYMQVVTPTGKWDPGFSPIIGMHRPGADIGWAFTWADKQTKLQLSGAAGVTFNFENTATDYKSGNEFHFEWAAGFELSPGLVLGIAGYDYRQLTSDSGAGALLGSFKGTVDAVGPALSYTTLVHSTPVVLSFRHYREYNVENRWDGNTTIATGTVRF